MVHRQRAADIGGLDAQRCGAEGVALRRADDADFVMRPVHLQHAAGDITGRWITAIRTCCALQPVCGLQQGCACLRTLTPQNQALVAGPGEAGEEGDAGERDQQLDECEACWA